MNQQNQDQPALEMENQQQQQPQQQQPQPNHQPQKCPRCESMNTKFCYYNNYSLSQPRYFCKTCRRYWTQGGTLRNVPVGGGCRKGKRAKDSSLTSSRSLTQPQAAESVQDHQQIQKNLTISTVGVSEPSPSSGLVSHQYYPAAGYYAAIQSLNQSQPFTVGGHDQLGGGPSSNMSLFNVSAPLASQQQRQFYQLGNNKSNMVDPSTLYPSDQESLLIQSTRPLPAAGDHDWPHQTFNINKSSRNASPAASESACWATTTSGHISTNTTNAGPSLNANQWPDLPGSYGPPN